MKAKIILLALMCCSLQLRAVIRLPACFSDHMVLQQQSEVSFWGWSTAGVFISIKPSWSPDTIKVRPDALAKWKTTLKTPKAGGPYQIAISTTNDKAVISDIMIGEVWLCSGQSNMAFSLSRLDKMPVINNPNIRILQADLIASIYPQDDLHDKWKVIDPNNAKSLSAVAYFAAQKLQNELHVSVGIINSSWGATPAEVWAPAEVVNTDSVLTGFARKQANALNRPNIPGSIWNAMVHPIAGYTIAGVFWYQGESNLVSWPGYHQLFTSLIKSWRKAWGYEFPFYYVQIAPYDYKSVGVQKAAMLREQQVKALTIPKTGMVVTTDLVPDIKNIHPPMKKEVGERLADLALNELYGEKKVDYKSPVYNNFEIKGNKVTIHFNYLEKGLRVKGDSISDLYIAGSDKVFYKAKGTIKRNNLIISAKEVPNPSAVRFGFTDIAMPNLFNTNGLPVSPFRTDDWTQN